MAVTTAYDLGLRILVAIHGRRG
eukprot:SAG11_NODE_3927_length_2144_cov_13.208802_1_plen_22_part_10